MAGTVDLYRYLDLRTRTQRQEDLNRQCLVRPMPGDVWREMAFTPVCMVLSTESDLWVTVTETTKPAGPHRYQFDEDKKVTLSMGEFRAMIKANAADCTPTQGA